MPDKEIDEQDSFFLAVSQKLQKLTWDERLSFFHKLGGIFCLECGDVQPNNTSGCQCTNDE